MRLLSFKCRLLDLRNHTLDEFTFGRSYWSHNHNFQCLLGVFVTSVVSELGCHMTYASHRTKKLHFWGVFAWNDNGDDLWYPLCLSGADSCHPICERESWSVVCGDTSNRSADAVWWHVQHHSACLCSQHWIWPYGCLPSICQGERIFRKVGVYIPIVSSKFYLQIICRLGFNMVNVNNKY